jgi:hypothetical protein
LQVQLRAPHAQYRLSISAQTKEACCFLIKLEQNLTGMSSFLYLLLVDAEQTNLFYFSFLRPASQLYKIFNSCVLACGRSLLSSAAARHINFLASSAAAHSKYCVQNPIPFWFGAHTMRNLLHTQAKTLISAWWKCAKPSSSCSQHAHRVKQFWQWMRNAADSGEAKWDASSGAR